MMIISVINTKGGIGKTCISTGIAGAFANRGKKVLIIDADPQGGTTSALGLGNGSDVDASLSGVLLGGSLFGDVIVKTKIDNLYGVPSSKQMERIAYDIEKDEDYRMILKEAVKEIEELFDYVIIDSPNAVSPLMDNVAYASDLFIVPFEGADSVARVGDLEEVLAEIRPEIDYKRIDVLNRLSKRDQKTLKRDVLNLFDEANIPRPTFEVRTCAEMAKINLNGGSITHHRPCSPGGKDIMALTHEVERILQSKDPSSSGWRKFLKVNNN